MVQPFILQIRNVMNAIPDTLEPSLDDWLPQAPKFFSIPSFNEVSVTCFKLSHKSSSFPLTHRPLDGMNLNQLPLI